MATETFRCEYVRCGKAGCRGCPHGPYWYAYWREGRRMRKRYIGREDPRGSRQAEQPHAHDAIFDRRTATPELAWQILGLRPGSSAASVKARYRALLLEHHPDRGGDPVVCQRLIAAYDLLLPTLR